MKLRPLVVFSVVACLGSTAAGDDQQQFHWEHAGHGGGGGFFSCAWHPTNPNVIYMGGDCNGMVKTQDKGLHWRFINRGIAAYGIYSIAIARSNPDIVYIQGMGAGVCKSIDGGEHWQMLRETAFDRLNISGQRPWTVRAVAVDPTNADIVYAGSVITGKLYKSVDGGTTWKELDIEHARVEEVPLEKPKAIPSQTKKAQPKAAAAPVRRDGITELGTWDQGRSPMGWSVDNGHPFVTAVNVTRDISTAGGKNKGGCLELTCDGDAGLNPPVGWAKLHYGPEMRDWSTAQKLTARFYLPPDAPVMEAQLGYLTTTAGRFWKVIEGPKVAGKPGEWVEVVLDLSGLPGRDAVKTVIFAIHAPKAEYKGKGYLDDVMLHGEEKRSPHAQSQTASSKGRGMVGSGGAFAGTGIAISSVAVAEKNPQLLIATHSERGVLRSTDGGQTWTQVCTAPAAWSVTIAPSNPDIVYCCYNTDEQMLRSSDGGRSWHYINQGIPPEYTPREIAVDHRDPDHIYVIGCAGWTGMIAQQPEGPSTMWGRGAPRGLAVHPKNPDVMYLSIDGDNGGGIYKSTDGGKFWSAIPKQPPSRRSWMGLHLDPTDSRRIYYGTTGSDGGLYRSDDAGNSWRLVFKGEQRWIMDFAISPAGVLYCGDKNLFVSSDRGEKWTRLTHFEGDWHISSVELDPKNPQRMWMSRFPAPKQPHPPAKLGEILQSVDGGKTWQEITGDHPVVRIYTLRLNPYTNELWSVGIGFFKLAVGK